jgi:uncharacterized protein
MIDVNAFIGAYPYRELPHPEPHVLVRVLEREGISRAWVGHLPTAFHRDVSAGNEALFTALEPFREHLDPVPAVRPDWPRWERALSEAQERGACAVRAYPPQWGMSPSDPRLSRLAGACGEAGIPLVLTTRFEDGRQRQALDAAPELSGAHIRALVRADPRVKIVVTAAGRGLIEESHWGLAPPERARLWWDISWIWGPPEDDLAHLLRTIGASRFLFGSGWPLRLVQAPIANLQLLPVELRSASLGQLP